MWMLSKCAHIAGVGLVRRPWANVSLASRKLKSSAINGSGTGNSGSNARRKTITLSPTVAMASHFLRASRPNRRSARRKRFPPIPGHPNEIANANAVRPNSKMRSVGLVASEDKTIELRGSAVHRTACVGHAGLTKILQQENDITGSSSALGTPLLNVALDLQLTGYAALCWPNIVKTVFDCRPSRAGLEQFSCWTRKHFRSHMRAVSIQVRLRNQTWTDPIRSAQS